MNKFRKYIFLFCLINILFFNDVLAQLMTNSNIGITISSTAQITVKGDIQNNASTTITNSGTIDLTGNWTNNAGNNNFGTSTGTVVLNGANQSVLGSSSTVFNNLTLQGSGTKTIGLNTSVGGGNASPAGVLDVGSVVLNLNSKTLSVTNSATTAVQSTTGYILSEATDNSSMVKWSINSTTGIHTVPFGNAAAVLIPLTYNLASGNAGDVSMSTYPTNAANLPLPTAPIAVTHIRDAGGANNSANMPDRYWEIDMTGSTAVANYTFTYAPAENATNGNTNTRVQHWYAPFAAWEAPLTGQLNPTAQSIYVPGASVSGVWGSALSGTPLPIELISFSAKKQNEKSALCEWTTVSEINNDFFTVEHSMNGIDFFPFDKVKGAGNSLQILNYKSSDNNPFKPVSYYRLKQTDFNGDFSYSKIVSINFSEKNSFAVFPNPNNGNFVLQINSDTEKKYSLQVYDVLGKLLDNFSFQTLQGEQNYEFDFSSLTPASYYLRLVSDNDVRDNKLVILK